MSRNIVIDLVRFVVLVFLVLQATVASAAAVEGAVEDPAGNRIAGAAISVQSANGTLLYATRSDSAGVFRFDDLPAGTYVLFVSAQGLQPQEIGFGVEGSEPPPTTVVLSPARVDTSVTVTAQRGLATAVEGESQVAISSSRREYLSRPLVTIGEAIEQQPGILLQKTTYAQVSPFLRGFTGYHVLNLIDGVRYNNAIFRSGPNQYLAFVDPTSMRRVEAVLGPSSSQYGSDSLGGVINTLSVAPRFATDGGFETHGEVRSFLGSADVSGGGSAQISVGSLRTAWLGGGSWRRFNDLRSGGGKDSHNVFARMFGLSSGQVRDLVGNRNQDSGFTQYGAYSKILSRFTDGQSLSLWYQNGFLEGSRGYRNLLGGRGRLRSSFDPQSLNFFYARYEKLGVGPFDSLSGIFSVNSQRDGHTGQNLNLTDSINSDRSRADVLGYSLQAATHFGACASLVTGVDYYDESIGSSSSRLDPISGSVRQVRPLYPPGSSYRTLSAFGQSNVRLIAGRLQLGVGGRYTSVGYDSPEQREFGISRSTRTFEDVTFSVSSNLRLTEQMSLFGLVSRGFRAPNVNDLGALGLNSLGFEIPAEDAIAAGALLSTSAGENALPKGALSSLTAESLYNYEVGLKMATAKLYARVQIFDSELYNPIGRRTLLFPASALPSELGGLPAIPVDPTPEQLAAGVAAVGNFLDPRAVKAFVNDGRSRYYGGEALVRYSISSLWTLSGNHSYIMGRILNPNQPIRRLPPQLGRVRLSYTPGGGRVWISTSVSYAAAQSRLSGGDRSDERIGAERSRQDIASFFNGARVGTYLDPHGELFLPTGETLQEIQDRVLPLGSTFNGVVVSGNSTRVPLFTQTEGWAAVGIHSGVSLTERLTLGLAIENLLDANYRLHASGADEAGFNAFATVQFSF